MIRRLSLMLLAALACGHGPAKAADSQQIVAVCGTPTGLPSYTIPGVGPMTVDQTGKLCVNASVSASITGFQPGANGTPIAVTTSSTTGTLPAGAVVVATNVGTNGAFCTLGATATNNGQYLSPGGGWFAFTVGAATQLSCIGSGGNTTVNMVGGSGLPTGTGGGGGSGGGGAVFGPTAVGSPAANPPVLMAGTANAGATGNVQVAKVDSNGTQFMDCSAAGNTLCGLINSPPPVSINGGSNVAVNGSTQGTAPSGNQTGMAVVDMPANASPTSCSASPTTSAASFLTASRLHAKIKLKVEGAGAVCFNNLGGTATIGSADTFCLKGATTANAGDGGSYVTPPGQTDNLAWSAIAATATSLVYCSWQ